MSHPHCQDHFGTENRPRLFRLVEVADYAYVVPPALSSNKISLYKDEGTAFVHDPQTFWRS